MRMYTVYTDGYPRTRRIPYTIEEYTGVFMIVYDVLLTVEENATRAELRLEE